MSLVRVWKVFDSNNLLGSEEYYLTSEAKAYDKVLELTKVSEGDSQWDYERCEVQ